MVRRPVAGLLLGVLLMPIVSPVRLYPREALRRLYATEAIRPDAPAGGNVGGVPFIPAVFGPQARVMVEAAFGANLAAEPQMWNWYDITSSVRQADGQRVDVTPMGRGDEASQAQPAGCSFELDNTSGDYTANDPRSKWFPYVRLDTPIRVTLNLTGYTADGSIRFQGYANGWTPSWDTSASVAVVTVSASGILRWFAKPKRAARSALYRAISRTTPAAWWPLEGGKLVHDPVAVFGTDLVAAPASLFSHADTGSVSGAVDGPAGASQAVDMSGGGQLTGYVTGTSGTSWRIAFAFQYRNPVDATESSDVITIRTVDSAGNPGWWRFNAAPSGANNWFWEFGIENPPNTFSDSASPALDDGAWHWVEIAAQDGSGTNATYTLTIDGVLAASGTNRGVIKAGSVRSIVVADSGDLDGASHLVVWPTNAALPVDTYAAFRGYAGETATARIARLCAEEGIPVTIVGTTNTTMGPQGADPLLTLWRECETADHGTLYDGRGPGLAYASRAARYNQAPAVTADMAADPPQVGDPFRPVDDDQRVRNIVKVDRKNGSEVTVEKAAGPLGTATVGAYDGQETLNVDSDAVLAQHGAFLTGLGVVDGFRYPNLNLDLGAVPAIAAAWLAAQVANRIDVTNVTTQATQHPPDDVSLLLEGWAESFNPRRWTVGAACSPYRPYEVHQVEAAGNRGRVDSAASSLAAAVASGATTLSVAVADGVLWRTGTPPGGSADIQVTIGDVGAGERMTVTDVSGAGSPQTFTVTRGVNGINRDWPAGATVRLWRPGRWAL